MPSYVFLVNWTDAGIRNVTQAPERGEAFRTAVERAGGRVLSFLHTMGIYDLVVAVELPDDASANRLALQLGKEGFVRTTTLKGWTAREFADLAGGL